MPYTEILRLRHPTSVIDRCCRGKVGPASPRRAHATLDLGHRSEGRRPCRRLTPADRRLVPDVLRSSLEIGSVQGSPRNRPSERGGRRMLISPSPKFGSLLRGLHDPAGSSSSTTERGKSSFERVGGDGSRSSLNGRRRPGFASLDDLKVISKPSHSRSPPLRGDTYCLMQGVRFRLT